MKTSRIGIIFRKEIWEIFRERRTILTVLVAPLLLTPTLFALMGVLINGEQEKANARTYQIGFVAPSNVPASILNSAHIHFVRVERREAEEQIHSHQLEAAVVLPEDYAARLAASKTIPLEILSDGGDQSSQEAAGRAYTLFSEAGQALASQRLASKGLPAGFIQPYSLRETTIKSGGGAANLLLSSLLPYLLIITAFSGTIYAAFDQVAGEKERGTLETLLVSPASRLEIVLGKFYAVVCVCLINSVLSIAGLGLAFGSRLHALSYMAAGGMRLSSAAVLVTFLALLPLSVLFGSLLLAISTYARNQKEAQTLMVPLFTLVMVPAVMSLAMSMDIPKAVALVPILNTALVIKEALSEKFDLDFIATSFAASIVYAGVALLFVTYLFQRETVLIKT